jgi:uncharacterized membrane protein YdjX (TVP38/TMEM64 family)
VGITGAAAIGYGIARRVVRGRVLDAVHGDLRCEAVRTAMLGSGAARAATIVALLRLAPVVPFGATNVLMASAGCPPLPFVAGTAAGILPRSALIVYMAAEMSALDFQKRPGLLLAGVLATVGVVMVLGVVAKRALARVTGGAAGATPGNAQAPSVSSSSG